MSLNQLFFRYCVYYPVVYLRGEPIKGYMKALDQTQWADGAAHSRIQNDKLRPLLDHARAHVPFYRDRIPARFGSLERLPFLTKEDLKTGHERLHSDRPGGPVTKKTTGGSTGQAVTVWKSRGATAQEQAAAWRGHGWAGIEIGQKQGRFWGVAFSPKDRRRAQLIDWIANRRRCSAFAFSEQDLLRYTDTLNRFKPDYFYGYVSMLVRYAQFLSDTETRLKHPVRAIVTTAEVLTTVQRRLLENTFQTRVFNEYGCGEIGTIAHECESGSMHLNAENMIVEIMDGEQPCAPNQLGEIVVTELNNHAMPLIRYRLGDFAAFSDEQCPCGRTLPTIREIAGRAYDLVYNREGKMFHGEFFMYMFEEAKKNGLGVEAFQVVQDSHEQFTIRVKPGPGYGPPTEELIRMRIRDGYGDYAAVDFVQVERIERERSGKMRLIVGLNSPRGNAA